MSAGLPLLLAGQFTRAAMQVLSIPVAVVLVPLGLRWNGGPGSGSEREWRHGYR